jgi:hypothetical protein
VLNPLGTREAHHRIFLRQMVLSCSLVGVGIHQLITHSRSEFAYVWIGFGVAVAGRELWRRRSCPDPRVNLVVGPEGIFIARRGQSAERNARFVIPWKDVSSVHSSWIYGEVVIKCGTVRHTVSWRELFEDRGWGLAAWQCTKAIREYGCTYGMRLGPKVRMDAE